ncbi:MAG: polyphosphate polymerase domain-containing protein [Actinomycetes bacterium]
MTILARAHLAALPVVDLAELNAAAALLTRVDRKYLLTQPQADAVLDQLPRGTRALVVAGERTPTYDSTYLDTPGLDSYRDAAHRRRRRWKVRTRTYVDSATSFLEVKTRRGSATVKERLPWRDGADLGVLGRDFIEASLASVGIALDAGALFPSLHTRYRRATLLLPGTPSRATLDFGLAWSDAVGSAHASWSDRVVLETKSGSGASALDRILWRLGHRPCPLSKYAVGLALLDPALPRNRWHRLLAS